MANYKLKGHEKFILREGWLSKGLLGVQGDSRVFSGIEATDKLAVGINMVKSIRYWMQSFGLVEENQKTGTRLTDLAQIITDNDVYLEDEFTLWILHSQIVKNHSKATTWYLFFNKCNVVEFTREEIFYPMKKELISFAKTDDFPEVSLKDDIDVLLNMYSRHNDDDDPEDKNRCPFASLGLLKLDGKTYYKQQPKLSRFSDYVILYELSCEFYKDDEIKKSISIDQVADRVFDIYNLSRVSVNAILDKLDNAEYIRVDRTAGLDVIYPVNVLKPLEVVKDYYNNR